jgi:hypothetical protein
MAESFFVEIFKQQKFFYFVTNRARFILFAGVVVDFLTGSGAVAAKHIVVRINLQRINGNSSVQIC